MPSSKIIIGMFLVQATVLAVANGNFANRCLAQETHPNRPFQLPEFQTEQPQFCWLSFPGSPKSLKMLIALDGPVLYADLNGNGDLTEANEKILSETSNRHSDRDWYFTIDEIRVGELVHESFTMAVSPLENYDRGEELYKRILETNPLAYSYLINAMVRRPDLKIAEPVQMMIGIADKDGVTQFASTIGDAPQINFDGDLEIRLNQSVQLRPGAASDIILAVGSAGSAPGLFASIGYENVIPKTTWPEMRLRTRSNTDDKPVDLRFPLPERC